MYNNNKPQANWIHQINTESGLRMYVSDKGAIKFVTVSPGGEERFQLCLTPTQAKMLVNASPDLCNLLLTPEYKAIEENKVLTKEREKINTQMQREQDKALKQAQAAIEQLKRLGLDVAVLNKSA